MQRAVGFKATFCDASSIDDALSAVTVDALEDDALVCSPFQIGRTKRKCLEKQVSKCRAVLKEVDLEPNNNQMALAMAAVSKLSSVRMLLQMPPGMGKSRVVGALIYLLLMQPDCKFTCVEVVFMHSELERVELPAILKLGVLFPFATIKTRVAHEGAVVLAG